MAKSIPKRKWPGVQHGQVPYRRNFPDSAYHRIVTKKAKLFGSLMYAVLVAGGHPSHFRYDQLRYRSLEEILDSLLPNSVHFKVWHERKAEKIKNCPICYADDFEIYSGMCECVDCGHRFSENKIIT